LENFSSLQNTAIYVDCSTVLGNILYAYMSLLTVTATTDMRCKVWYAQPFDSDHTTWST